VERGSASPKVLCVDDESSILSALRRVFLDEPWDVLYASSGEEGLALIRKHEVDLVLSDYRMPGMDGVEFLKRAKEVQPDTVRIVLSGYADINVIVNALNEGQVYRFISKPWNDDELLHNIRKALDHYRADRENRRLNDQLRELNASLERKVEERTRELVEKNRALRFANLILELLPMPVLGVDRGRIVVFANAQARRLLGEKLVDRPAPDLFEPELTGTIERAEASGEGAHHVMPMVIDGEPVGAIILTADENLEHTTAEGFEAFPWSVAPLLLGEKT